MHSTTTGKGTKHAEEQTQVVIRGEPAQSFERHPSHENGRQVQLRHTNGFVEGRKGYGNNFGVACTTGRMLEACHVAHIQSPIVE